jgi:hypothetical protein
MALSEVLRTELTKRLGLTSTADDAAVLRAVDDRIAGATPVSVAEKQARAEDRRTVLAAVADGRIADVRVDFWCQAMQSDRAGNRAVLASLAPGLMFPAAGIRRSPPAARAAQTAPPVDGIQETVTTYDELSAAIRSDPEYHRALWQMGVRSIEKPPAQITGWKDPDAPYIAMNDDGTGQWVYPARERLIQEMDALAVQDRALREQQAEREAEAQAKYREDKNKWREM